MMIKGDGFFVVQLPSGESGFRRDGAFYRSANGRLETIDGYPVQPELIIPPNVEKVDISEDGVVHATIAGNSNDRPQLGQIQVATFVNNGGLKAIGKNLFISTEASGPPNVSTPGTGAAGGILQHYVEGSNVDVVREMTDMISAQRAFEMNSKVIQAVDQLLQHTVNVR